MKENFVISSYNIALFTMRAVTMAVTLQNLICPWNNADFVNTWALIPGYKLLVSEQPTLSDTTGRALSLSQVPIFLWVTDAFLLYRAWVIWVYHRKYVVIPALAYLASVICGIVWLAQNHVDAVSSNGSYFFSSPNGPGGLGNVTLDLALFRWIPALGFSCGLDVLTTGMIAGRLTYHHRNQKKLTERRTTFYMPIVTIFIESAALSSISKILQLAIPALENNPVVIPLCTISSNLIVLRKALGADAGEMMAKKPQDLSTLRFSRRRPQAGGESQVNDNLDTSIPGGFGSQLVQPIGGHTIDVCPFDDENSERSSAANVPKERVC